MPPKPTRPHSVVVVKLPQSETVVVVCEEGSAAYLKWEDQTWGRLRAVPGTEADEEYPRRSPPSGAGSERGAPSGSYGL